MYAATCTCLGSVLDQSRIGLGSGAALGVADVVFPNKNVPLISAQNTAPILTDPFTHQRTYFRTAPNCPELPRTAPNDQIQGWVDSDCVRDQLGAKLGASVSDSTAYANQLGGVFARRH